MTDRISELMRQNKYLKGQLLVCNSIIQAKKRVITSLEKQLSEAKAEVEVVKMLRQSLIKDYHEEQMKVLKLEKQLSDVKDSKKNALDELDRVWGIIYSVREHLQNLKERTEGQINLCKDMMDKQKKRFNENAKDFDKNFREIEKLPHEYDIWKSYYKIHKQFLKDVEGLVEVLNPEKEGEKQ